MSERNVSGLERAEGSLWQRSAAITASIDGMAILDRRGAYTYMNDAHAEICGYDDPEEILGKTWDILYDEEHVRWFERHIMPTLERDGHWRGEAIGKRRDGSTFPQEVSLTTIEGGGFVCVVRDITERKRAEEEIWRLSHYNRTLFEANLAALMALSPEGTITDVNKSTEEVIGLPREELIGTDAFSYFEEPKRAREWFRRVLSEGAVRGFELDIRNSDGGTTPVSYNATVYRDEEGEVAGVLASARDITDRRRAEEKLREAERKYRALVERIPAVTYIQALEDPSDTVYVSPQIEEILGYTPEECISDPEHWIKVLHPDDRERVLAEDRRTNRTAEPFSMEYRQIAKDGRVVWLQDEAALVRDEEGRPEYWIGVQLDITERKVLEERLEHQALHDPLTGLPNRVLFMDRLEHALTRADRRAGKVAVLFTDLDNFKDINDSLGHEVGDQLLVAVAGRLRACLRPGDTAARLAGDEFTVLLEDVTSASDATRVAERIAEELRTSFTLEGQEIFVTASIGIALGTSALDRPADLLRNADLALYQAKDEGRAQHKVFEEVMNTQTVERLELASDLRRAIERGEFKVYYQPKVLLGASLQEHLRFKGNPAIVAPAVGSESRGERRIVGMEALVRWEHPERGLLSASEFVSIAEETDLIHSIGRWVLEEACRQAREWQEQYLGEPLLGMCVNLSARQFRHPHLARDVTQVLRETGIEPHSLCLEITESVVMEDAQSTVATLREIKDLGVQLAIDDFGTGYSSLSYLKRFSAEFLKIDQSFVGRLEEEPNDVAIVAGIISLAHTLGMRVIAEGVESAQQVERLRRLGCDLAQGNYFSEPLPSEAAERLLVGSVWLRNSWTRG